MEQKSIPEETLVPGKSIEEVLSLVKGFENSGKINCRANEQCKYKLLVMIHGDNHKLVRKDTQYVFFFDENSSMVRYDKNDIFTGP